MDQAGDITVLLHQYRRGDREAYDRLVTLVYDQLRDIARRQVGRGWSGRTLDTTALVHEAYMQLGGDIRIEWQDRGHFFAISARAMRRILVDHARMRGARKRGGGQAFVDRDPDSLSTDDRLEMVLAVDEAVVALERINPRLARLVECRYFAGLGEAETAAALDVSVRTVQRDWPRARAWLLKALG